MVRIWLYGINISSSLTRNNGFHSIMVKAFSCKPKVVGSNLMSTCPKVSIVGCAALIKMTPKSDLKGPAPLYIGLSTCHD